MCPEMNEGKDISGQKNKLIFVCVFAAFVIVALGIGGWLIYRNTALQRIPELKKLAELKDAVYSKTHLCVYDGENISVYYNYSSTIESGRKTDKLVRKFCSLRGRKASDWTPDKITYPVYSLQLEPSLLGENDELGETVVWSNGYLFTSSGGVYKCDADFTPFMDMVDDDDVREGEMQSIADIRAFRPLTMAYSKWQPELMRDSFVSDDEIVEGIEAKVTGVRREHGYPVATVEITNNSDKAWHYCNQSIFTYIDVTLDGRHYYVFHDPDISDSYYTMPGYNEIIEPGETDTREFGLWLYGNKLPKGDYRILIRGQDGDEDNYACAEYKIK